MRYWFLLAGFLIAAVPAAAAEKPLAELDRAARANPASTEAWDRLGQALARERRFPEAQQAFARALKLAPQARHILHHAALAYAWSGDYKEAARRYRELLARHPADTELRVDYGQVLAWDRQFIEARRQYETVLKANPRHVEALRHLAVLGAWQDKYDDALRLLERAQGVEPKNPRVLADRAEVLSWKGDLAAAAEAYQQALALAPKRPDLLLKLAQVYRWHGRIRPARETYEKVLALERDNVDAYLGLVRAYKDNHQYVEAERVLRQALARLPNDARLNEERAALAAGRSASAHEFIERVEPLFFIVILAVLARHIWRYRRVLRGHRTVTRLLLTALPALAVLTAVVYAFVLIGGAYYREIATAAQLLELLALAALLAMVITLVWLLRFERPRRAETVLAIGAHPDDLEFGCGATLLRMREEGCRTVGLVLTGGGRGAGAEADARLAEAHAGARVLAIAELELRDFPDTRLSEHKEAIRQAIEETIERLQPDVIFTHNAHDAHTDHKTVFEATREAARGPCTLLCYENPNTPPVFNPDHFVDIEGYLDDKITALARHKSQADKPYADPQAIRAAAGFRGTQARVKYAEAFETLRRLEKAAT
jgi:LmbE family N-acetylglucosaminyl deacetylase/cytochrome c-type biogenesis protein CcmH/NrfG